MNKAKNLLDKDYVKKLLEKEILPLYPDFTEIKSIKINRYKDFIWEGHTYHMVIEYRTSFVTNLGKVKTLPIF